MTAHSKTVGITYLTHNCGQMFWEDVSGCFTVVLIQLDGGF